jgi:hypothetical protein
MRYHSPVIAPQQASATQSTENRMPGIATESHGEVTIDETINLIASDKVEGTAVYDRDGNRLGSVQTAMIDKVSGQVVYVVISFGGVLTIGAKLSALPWKSLMYDPAMGGYVVNVTRDQLRGAPQYAGDADSWLDPLFGRAIDDYYCKPYWK